MSAVDDDDVVLPSTGETKVSPGRFETPLGRLMLTYCSGRVARQEVTMATIRRTKTVLGVFSETYGRRPVEQLGRSHVERFLEIRGTQVAPATLRHDIVAIKGFARYLLRERHIKRDPMAYVQRVRVPRSVPRALTRDEVSKLWAVLPDDRARAIVALMLGCGLRRAEVQNLQVGDWDQRDQTLRILGKGGHERVVPVPAFVAAALRRYMTAKALGPMITTQDGSRGLSHSYYGRMMGAWMADAGIKSAAHDGRSCHSLRHTLASDVADIEPDLRVLQQILGHVNLTSTQIYLRRVHLPKMRAAMDAVVPPD